MSDSGHAGSPGGQKPHAAAPLTETEKAILTSLQIDGRASAQSIGRQLGLSQKVVRRTVSHLLNERGIRITTVTVPALLGYDVMAFAEFKSDGTRSRRDVAASLAGLDCVDYVVTTTGPSDITANLVCKNLSQLSDVLEKEVKTISGAELIEVTPYVAFHYQKMGRSRPATRYEDPEAPATSLDQFDRDLILALSEDGRTPYKALAEQLGVSESHVRARLKRLVEAGVVRICAIVDAGILGYGSMLWGKARVGGAPILDAVRGLIAIDAVTYVAETTGSFDLMFELTCIDDVELRQALDRIRQIPSITGVIGHLYFDVIYKPMIPRVGTK
ncbi:MAG: AsnC family transcriptional regulator [Cryobacterium sp.]|jgi:DNA-binding Lrp family transcriptional regulator|nr:AsnC family transcriptional regulator [Cryobacterium sp.]